MDSPAVNLDLDRHRRCGFPEVIYGPGKTNEQLCEIVKTLVAHRERVLATRLTSIQAASLLAAFPQGRHNEIARTFRLGGEENRGGPIGHVAVISAGTGDLPVAEEARETLEWMGVR